MRTFNKTTLFIILTFIISFSSAGIYKLFGGTGPGNIGFTILGSAYMFVPTICVLIVEKLIHKEKIKHRLLLSFKPNRWFLVAWLFMPVVAFSTLGISLLFPGVSYNPEMTGLLDRLAAILPPEEIEKAKSVIAAAILHGTLNATVVISIIGISGGNDITSGITGLPGFIVLFVFLFILFIYDRYIDKNKILLSRISKFI